MASRCCQWAVGRRAVGRQWRPLRVDSSVLMALERQKTGYNKRAQRTTDEKHRLKGRGRKTHRSWRQKRCRRCPRRSPPGERRKAARSSLVPSPPPSRASRPTAALGRRLGARWVRLTSEAPEAGCDSGGHVVVRSRPSERKAPARGRVRLTERLGGEPRLAIGTIVSMAEPGSADTTARAPGRWYRSHAIHPPRTPAMLPFYRL